MLCQFGFGERMIDMVWRLISNWWYSLIVNGQSYGFFKSTRGVRQGDPLSPSLFILASEVLSRGIKQLANSRQVEHFTVPSINAKLFLI